MAWVWVGPLRAGVIAAGLAAGVEEVPRALETGDPVAVESAVGKDPRAAAAWFADAWLAYLRARAAGEGAGALSERLERVASAFERAIGSRAPRARLERAAAWAAPALEAAIAVSDAWRRGREALGRGAAEAAEEAWREAADGAARLGDLAEAARIRHALAGLAARAGRRKDAIALAEEALSTFRAEGDPIGEADALSTLAGLSSDEGRARDLLREAAEIYERIGDRVRAGLARFNRAVSLRDAGSKEDARIAFEEAAARLAGTRYEGLAWRNVGSARAACGDPARADEAFRRAFDAARAAGDATEAARVADERGDLLRGMGDAGGAEASYASGVDLLPAPGADPEIDRTAERARTNLLADLGSLRAERGDLRGALRAFLDAARAARRLADADEIARALANLGNLALRQGNAPQALSWFRLALEADREGKRRDRLREALFQENVGLALAEIGERAQALATYRGAIETLAGTEGPEADRARARTELKIAALLRDEDPSAARASCERAREILERIGDRVLLAAAVNNLGNLLADAGEHEKAADLFRRSLDLRDGRADPLGRAIALSNLGESLLELGRSGDARAATDEALAILEERRGAAATAEDRDYFLKGKGAFHETAVRAALAGGRGPEAVAAAFGYEERAKARSLLDLLAERGSSVEPSRPAAIEEIRARLAPGEILLAYLVGDRGSWLFALRREGGEVHDLPDRRALRERIDPLVVLLRAPGSRREELDRARIRAAEAVLGPAAEAIARADRLIVVPDDVLHRIPFEVLPPPRSAGDPPPYLIERLSVRYAPSATILRDLGRRGRDPRPARAVIFADPAYAEGRPSDAGRGADPRDGGRARPKAETLLGRLDALLGEARDVLAGPFPRLPGTAEEARAISSLFAEGAAHVIAGPDATEERLKDPATLRGATILHIAAHAFVLERDPLGSAIALAPGPREDGLVDLREIQRLPVEADLVVLSACTSGGGEIAGGEGILGFARAFLYAGASDILVSLWSVHDRAGAVLLPAFYEALARGGADPADALRAAKLDYVRRGYRRVRDAGERGLPVVRRAEIDARHPYYWAPFVLVGAGPPREERGGGRKP